MKVTPPRWNLTTGIKYVNYIFFSYKQTHHTSTTSAPHRAPSPSGLPIPGLRNSLCQPGQQGRGAGLSLGMWAHRAHRAHQRMRMARCWSTSPTSKPKQLRRLGYRPNYWNRRGRAGLASREAVNQFLACFVQCVA